MTLPQSQSQSNTVSSVYLRCQKESTESMLRVGPQQDEAECGEEERLRNFVSSKSQVDPSAILGFEDYLVNTYEDQPHLSPSSSSLVVAAALKQQSQVAAQNDINSTHQRFMFEPAGGTETDETNLLDETSRFVKKLNQNSGVAWTDFQGTALTTETVRRLDGMLSSRRAIEDEFIENDSRQNLTSGRQPPSKNNYFIQSGQLETQTGRTAFQELTTNSSRNVCNDLKNRTAVTNVLKQQDLAMSGPSFQNDSSFFKSSNQNMNNLQQNSSHFITFKPASNNTLEARNPFPSKVRPDRSESSDGKPTIVQTNFIDNVRDESDCYQLPFSQKVEDAPGVQSQYSNATSPESGPRALLTMSQLGPLSQASSTENVDVELGTNFCPGQLSQQKFVVSVNQYPNPLGEMPSQIQEESQEFSVSIANAKESKLKQEEIEEELATGSLLNTQESKFELQQLPVAVVAEDSHTKPNNFQALSTEQEPLSAIMIADHKNSDVMHEKKAFVSDSSNLEVNMNNAERDILSERQIEMILENVDDQAAEMLSQKVRSQTGINPYSTMEEGSGTVQSENQLMVGLARALLKQLSSQRDHFSQETLAHLTSNNSQQHLEQATDQISLIEADQDSAIIDECTSVCSELTNPIAAASAREYDVSADNSNVTVQTNSSAKELYEMRMRGIRKKREQAKPTKVGKKKPTRAVAPAPKTITTAPVESEQKVVKKLDQSESDNLYRRNMQWKRQINDVNAEKKQKLDRERAKAEVKECTFTPKLIANNEGVQNEEKCANSQVAQKSSGPVVEDRCLQWAAHSLKKKQQNERILHELSECTFQPTLFSQEFKNRVCPSYDLKHKERVATNAALHQEFNYFTLKNYLQMNHDSVQDLERLCKLYSSSVNKTGNNDHVNNLKESSRQTEVNKLFQIAEFIQRSETWLKQVQAKKVRVAEEVNAKREEENTFHPRVDPMSEILHARKLKKLSKAAISPSRPKKDTKVASASGGLLETQKKDKLYQYYLPVIRPDQKDKQISEKSQGAVKREKRGNKHPTLENTEQKKIETIDFAAESRKFNKLIEVINERLSESKISDGEKKEMAKATVNLCQQMLLSAQSSLQDDQISFCNNQQLTEEMDEVMSADGTDLIKVFSEQDQMNSVRQKAEDTESEETSRFQSIKTLSNRVSPLDLTRVVQHFAQGLLTPTLTDPSHFQGSSEEHVNQNYINQHQLQKLKEEVNLDTLSQETYTKNAAAQQMPIFEHQQESAEKAETEAAVTTLDREERRQALAFSYEDSQIRITNESPLYQRPVSSSMRKHLDFIYKRQMGSSRQHTARTEYLNQDLQAVKPSTPTSRQDVDRFNSKTERSQRSRRSSSSNTDGLFRKRNSRSNSKHSSQLKDQLEHQGTMTSCNIQNMILLEHIPPATPNDDTPVRKAKESLVCEASSVRNDPTICRLAEKLRGMKEKEQLKLARD